MKNPAKHPRIKITIELSSLGGIPEKTMDHNAPADVEAFLDGGGADMPLAQQLQVFGNANAESMIHDELTSWLEDLGAGPENIKVAFEGV